MLDVGCNKDRVLQKVDPSHKPSSRLSHPGAFVGALNHNGTDLQPLLHRAGFTTVRAAGEVRASALWKTNVLRVAKTKHLETLAGVLNSSDPLNLSNRGCC